MNRENIKVGVVLFVPREGMRGGGGGGGSSEVRGGGGSGGGVKVVVSVVFLWV